MKRQTVTLLALLACLLVPATNASAHCEVPCGIYADQNRFEAMMEDQTTIAKAIDQIHELASAKDAKSLNQLARWVATKETHATNVQHVVAQYFLTQRIKSDNPKYVDQLKAAHAVMVAAMKCKQDADPATATALRESILNLYRAYEGKEPNIEG